MAVKIVYAFIKLIFINLIKKGEEQEGGGEIWFKNEVLKELLKVKNGNKFAILSQIEESEDSGEVDKTEIDATVKTKRVEM